VGSRIGKYRVGFGFGKKANQLFGAKLRVLFPCRLGQGLLVGVRKNYLGLYSSLA
jgi:hypothetical protein